MQTTAGTCNGNGDCVGATITSCGAYICNGTTCFTSCTGDEQCATGNHCTGSACVGAGAPGDGCDPSLGASACLSGYCGKNGVCCAESCPDFGADSCSSTGACTLTTGACEMYPSGTKCESGACAAGMQTTAKSCDGIGSCNQGGAITSCAPYLCGTSSCASSCGSDAECASGAFCAGTICIVKRANGAACASTNQCASGFCVDGLCCDTACSSACQGCSASLTGGANGTCSSAKDGAADPRGQCATTAPSSCGTDGKCAGGACRAWASGTACAVCSSGTQATTGTCTGFGSCTGTATSCAAGDFCWLGACGRLTAVSAGRYRTCALTTAGGVQCWGDAAEGGLGDGSSSSSYSPVPVAVFGLSSGIAAVSTGGAFHGCALTTAGGVRCWGRNDEGQLGNNSTVPSLVPVAVSGLSSGIAAIAADDGHTCALTKAGGVLCWGANFGGQLGNNSTTSSAVPVPVQGLSSPIVAISVGGSFTCALTTGGGVQCWGVNFAGQLGNNTTYNFDTPLPVAVAGLSSGVAAISAGGYHSCALTSAGGVKCWGSTSTVPVAVSGLSSGVAAIAAGEDHTCALTTGGGVLCWGANSHGQLGNNSTTSSAVPVSVSGLSSGVVAISASGDNSCALAASGVKCWGWNQYGQLGNNSTTDSLVPVSVVEP